MPEIGLWWKLFSTDTFLALHQMQYLLRRKDDQEVAVKKKRVGVSGIKKETNILLVGSAPVVSHKNMACTRAKNVFP